MAKRKRKGNVENSSTTTIRKKQRIDDDRVASVNCPTLIDHPVLNAYFSKVITLREYVKSKLALVSKRRSRIFSRSGPAQSLVGKPLPKNLTLAAQEHYEQALPLLDTVLIGVHTTELSNNGALEKEERVKEYEAFSQHLSASGSVVKSQLGSPSVSLSEIIDFAIWCLFYRKYPSIQKPPNVLCCGFLRASSTWRNQADFESCNIPGLMCTRPNEHVSFLKNKAWRSLFHLLGHEADQIMISLIINCALFMPVSASTKSFYQLSGHFLSDLKPIKLHDHSRLDESVNSKSDQRRKKLHLCANSVLYKNSDIRFVRSRMLYARAALNAKGEVAFGLRHIHVLSRYGDPENLQNTIHVMKYVFPRQFALHNVFTSRPDPKKTAQTFQDYTLREDEIARMDLVQKIHSKKRLQSDPSYRLPKRLRGPATQIIRQMQICHLHCSYTQLLAHYCPLSEVAKNLLLPKTSLALENELEQLGFRAFTTPVSSVSAFCRAVVGKIFPAHVWGSPENANIMHKNIDVFLKGRKYESFSLEFALRGLKVKEIPWVRSSTNEEHTRIALSDFQKRVEILAEFVYYVFDSFLIPLVRTNFHVTESTTDKNKLYFFRQDVWRRMCDPALNRLKSMMLEGNKSIPYSRLSKANSLGFSQLRLLPKNKGMRAISNLRRRMVVNQNGGKVLGKSINSSLSPVYHVLNFEKLNQESKLGSSLFSVSGMYHKLKHFRDKLEEHGHLGGKLFFAKVDVKGCFDSIPQQKLMELARALLSADEYTIAHFAEVKQAQFRESRNSNDHINLLKNYAAQGYAGQAPDSFAKLIANSTKMKFEAANAVYIDTAVPQVISKTQILQLLNEHVVNNIVKIGKKFYRQKQGISQGSIVSTLLCNFFYGDLESNYLQFLDNKESVLFRVIDDFLLITTNIQHAQRFLNIMYAGIPSYGVSVAREKCLVNFDARIAKYPIARLPTSETSFPYCGMFIDSTTLSITKDLSGSKTANVADSLTVEGSRRPGNAFQRKTLSVLRIQMHPMLLDTQHNSPHTVMKNLFQMTMEVALKAYVYMKCLSKNQKPSIFALKKVVEHIYRLSYGTMTRKKNRQRNPDYQCVLSKNTTRWLIFKAFLLVFKAKQSTFTEFLTWLDTSLAACSLHCKYELFYLERVASACQKKNKSKTLNDM